MTRPDEATTAEPVAPEPVIEDPEAADLDSIEEDPAPEIPKVAPSDSVQLAKLDPFRKYLVEIKKFTSLTPEEEEELAIRYRDHNDQEAAYRLVTSNLKLVVKIALMYNRVWSNVMDLIQEGNIGLMEAVRRFDPFKGARLPTYATWWIKAYVIKFVIDNFRIVRVGTTNERRRLLFNLRKEKEKLRLQGIEPTPQLIAKKLNVSVEDVRDVEQNIEAGDVSLEAPIDTEESIPLKETLHSAEDMIDERLARGELSEVFNQKIQEFSSTLTEREKVILGERLLAEDPKTLREIAERFGVTREAIRLNEKSLITKIKAYMQEALKGVTRVEIGLLE
jgi:RNA polymerase sigma-32 factor